MWHGVILVKIIECSHSHLEHVNPQQKASSLSSIIHWFLVLYNILLVAVDFLENISYHTGIFLYTRFENLVQNEIAFESGILEIHKSIMYFIYKDSLLQEEPS